MDSEILWRVAVVQAAAVAALSLLLALFLPQSFFASWGWLSGPLAWLLCARLTAWVVGLPPTPVLVRAVLAGIPSLLFVIVGLHWLGALVAVAILAAWCAYLPRPLAGDSHQAEIWAKVTPASEDEGLELASDELRAMRRERRGESGP